MKNKLVFVAAVALIASGMALAQSGSTQSTTDTQSGSSTATAPQTSGHTDANDLPATKEGQSQPAPQTAPKNERPGAMGSPENAQPAPQGETPATGARTDDKKGTIDNNDARPGTTTPPPADRTNVDKQNMSGATPATTPEYAKPITTADPSAPSQQSTDSGTSSPK